MTGDEQMINEQMYKASSLRADFGLWTPFPPAPVGLHLSKAPHSSTFDSSITSRERGARGDTT